MRISVADIQRAVCQDFGLTRQDLFSDLKTRNISYPRQIIYYLAKEMTSASYSAIGRRMGRDHSTVIHGVQAIRSKWFKRGKTYRDVNRIRSAVLSFAENDNNPQIRPAFSQSINY